MQYKTQQRTAVIGLLGYMVSQILTYYISLPVYSGQYSLKSLKNHQYVTFEMFSIHVHDCTN